jgi:hypothetical protein
MQCRKPKIALFSSFFSSIRNSIELTLYTVRVTLTVLGAEDYGVYNAAAGIATMFSFLSDSMDAASQRCFSFGRNNREGLAKTFSLTISETILKLVTAYALRLLSKVRVLEQAHSKALLRIC